MYDVGLENGKKNTMGWNGPDDCRVAWKRLYFLKTDLFLKKDPNRQIGLENGPEQKTDAPSKMWCKSETQVEIYLFFYREAPMLVLENLGKIYLCFILIGISIHTQN